MTDLSPVEAILFAALEKKSPAERKAYLDGACSGQPELRAKVEKLLAAHSHVGSFLEPPAGMEQTEQFAAPAKPTPLEGTVVAGRYKLLQQIGEGGMGSVWMADQTEPVKRRVAVKLIRVERGSTKMILSRFEAERQAIALMDHPHIARLLDAGTTQEGQPYFVMELVKGIPLTYYCDTHKLGIPERLALFQQVCSAVQHAHQKGIIHRDLKPSNILVESHDGQPVPKVIDFGLAKAASGMQLSDHTLFTAFGTVMGTPTYMAPEQATFNAVDVDTRADVYSLGVILYELLTGTTPISRETVKKAAMDEVLKLVREQDAPKPSSRLSSSTTTNIAANRSLDAGRLSKLLRGDLDWIVLKALEKDRQRRYETANGLAADIQRHLANEPVIARPPSALYRLHKTWQRNKFACAAGAAITASLVIGLAASVWQAVRADHEAKRAKLAERQAVVALDELRATAPAFAEQARALAAQEQFSEALEKLDYALKLQPGEAEFLVAKGDLLQCQLQLAAAAAIYREALRVQPSHARAAASAKLCDELLSAKPNERGKLTRESLAKLHLALQRQQRPAAELMPVARLLGVEKQHLVDYWLARLKDLPVSAENPLEKRLTVREDGRLALDLSDTKVLDLTPLSGAPLAALNLSQCQELSDLSHLRGLQLIELNVSKTSVADLSPLREMLTLETLDVSSSQVSDLTALNALRLKVLECKYCPISDLNPIRKMPLEAIDLMGTRVADLSPLIGMRIKSIDLSMAPVLDFSPLAQLPLEKCYLQRNRITDLAVLRGKPLKELVIWGCEHARNYAVLTEIKTLELILIPDTYRDLPAKDYEDIGALRNLPKLRQIGSEIMNRMGYAATGSKDVFWQEWDREQACFAALRAEGIIFKFHKLPGGAYVLDIFDQPLRDLSILAGMPIDEIDLHRCPFVDLTPLRALKLKKLSLSSNFVTDFTPLRGMPIERLYLNNCSNLRDLSPLTELPLRELYLDGCQNLTDVAALAEISTLNKLTVPIHARNVDALRKLSNLKRVGFQMFNGVPDSSVEEFWESYAWVRKLHEAGIKPQGMHRLDSGLWDLNLTEADVSNLSKLQGMPIESLSLWKTQVTDLSPLQGMPLTFLELSHTPIAELGPLRDMPLKNLRLFRTQVSDLSPLQGLSLERLDVSYTNVTDISVLRGMPLFEVGFNSCPALTDISPLADCKELQVVTLPPNAKNFEFLRAFTKLKRLSFGENKTPAEFWRDYDSQGWLRTVRESGVVIKSVQRLPGGTWQMDLSNSAISDLTILKGAPISDLHIGGTAVADLTPLRGMTLKKLSLGGTKVTDLSPLEGMRLEHLQIIGTNVKDLTVLRGMPLTSVRFLNCKELTDLSPLADCKELQNIQLPPNATNIEFLRAFPKLTRIGFRNDPITTWLADKTAVQFWKDYDAKRK